MPATLLVPNPRSQEQIYCSHSMVAIAKIILCLSFLSVAPFQMAPHQSLKDLTENDIFIRKGKLTIDLRRTLEASTTTSFSTGPTPHGQQNKNSESFSDWASVVMTGERKQLEDVTNGNCINSAVEGSADARQASSFIEPSLACKGFKCERRNSPYSLTNENRF